MNIRLVLFLLSFCICLSAQAQNPRYQLIQGDFNWFEAKLDAEKRGGHLATITSQQEWDTIRTIVPPSVLEGKTIWIGGTDSRVEGQWEWITGEPWGGFVNWRGGEPNGTAGGGESDFIEMTPLSGSPWNDAFGSEKRQYYLLEYEFPLPTPRYQLVEGSFTWYEAKADAEKRGGHLVTITSEAERQAILSVLSGKRLSFWIGLVRLNGTAWNWITGEVSEYLNWSPGQPNGGAGLGDVAASSSPGLTWDDLYKDQNPPDRLPYILEFESIPQPPVQIEFVTVGDVGNSPDSTGYGKVDYVFQIGKFEVNNLQYAAFLNAKAKSDPHSLYDTRADDPHNGIVRFGSEGSFIYAVKNGMEHRPVALVNFYKAMRFANWLNNGGTSASDTETGAYSFAQDGSLPKKRNLDAKIFLPSENEWYKAAYYQPVQRGGPPTGYWLYATRSNIAPLAEPPPGGSNSANYGNAILVSDNSLPPSSDVGAYVSASSYYGTFDQTGNVWEWNETALNGGRAIRGGGTGEPSSKIQSLFRFENFNDGAGWEAGSLGFRIAAAFPPPISLPTIVTQPQSQSVVAGNSVTFSATATGTSPLTYQWRKGGVNISSATLNTYTIGTVQAADSGLYSVLVSNVAGAVVSSAATLTVITPSPLVNAFNLSRLAFGPSQGLRIPLSPPDRTAFAIETSADLKTWVPLITFPSNSGPFEFIDSSAVGQPLRFYRAVKR